MLYDLEYGDEGTDVRRLQEHLNEALGAGLSPDGGFGTLSRTALREAQKVWGLSQTGKVDEPTFNALAAKGLVLLGAPGEGASASPSWPPLPSGLPQPTASKTMEIFGHFEFRWTPAADNPERIEILGDWVAQNIVEVHIPQLDRCLFAAGRHNVRRERGTIQCHRLAAPLFVEMFKRWDEAGLMDRVLTCAGAFNARLKRGSTSASPANLSNHSWGTAIDLNAEQNPLGHVPMGVGARGCLREMIAIANGLGIFWGGHYASRPDGMHFEVGRV